MSTTLRLPVKKVASAAAAAPTAAPERYEPGTSTLRLPAKKAPPASPAPTPQPAAPAKAKAPERTPEEKAERARVQAEFERKAHLEAVQRRQRRVRKALAEFRRRWPAAFTTPVPLAIGADKLIRAELPEMSTMRLKEVLGPWTHSTAYLRAVAAGVERINLDGSSGGVPDQGQREHAVEALRKRGKWPVEGVQDASSPAVAAEPSTAEPA